MGVKNRKQRFLCRVLRKGQDKKLPAKGKKGRIFLFTIFFYFYTNEQKKDIYSLI